MGKKSRRRNRKGKSINELKAKMGGGENLSISKEEATFKFDAPRFATRSVERSDGNKGDSLGAEGSEQTTHKKLSGEEGVQNISRENTINGHSLDNYLKEHKKYTLYNNKFALVMMVKDEAEGISLSLESCKDYADEYIFLDTGSTDGTQKIIKDFCEKNNITLHLKEEPFINFCVSRNVLLDYADEVTKCSFQVLMDSRDELRNGVELKKVLNILKQTKDQGAYYLTQRLYYGHDSTTTFFNVRMIRTRSKWRYKGSVHEYMDHGDLPQVKIRIDGDMCLYQDVTKDGGKSMRRYARDKELLEKEYEKDPDNTRTQFYLAQTLSCLGELEACYDMYLKRAAVQDRGFREEVFHAYNRAGDCALKLGKDWSVCMDLYMKAWTYMNRAEPLIRLAMHYRDKHWHTAWMFIKMACELRFPEHHILFIDRSVYDYKRWHVMGIIGYYTEGRHREGYLATLKAIEAQNKDIDKQNLKHYENMGFRDHIKVLA